MSDENHAKWDAIIDDLRGTCQSEAEHGEETEALFNDMDFCAYLDDHIFRCTACGWWCDIDEEDSDNHGLDEWTCRDCCE